LIAAVLLDVGGVFVLPDPSVLSPIVSSWGGVATPDDLARGHYAGVAAMDRVALERGVTADWPAYSAAFVAEVGIPGEALPGAAASLGSAYEGIAWNRVVPGSVSALRRLAATGVALGIVSNSNGTVEEQLLASGICQVGAGQGVPVTVVLDSFVVGIEKPDPRIFERALSALEVPAESAIHVGDTGWADVAGARAAGVRPVHLDPFGFCPAAADHDHVRSLDDVVALVAAAAT
jgi:putative hydrolase of the HAD superfamily